LAVCSAGFVVQKIRLGQELAIYASALNPDDPLAQVSRDDLTIAAFGNIQQFADVGAGVHFASTPIFQNDFLVGLDRFGLL
jgi:hypothetical protein